MDGRALDADTYMHTYIHAYMHTCIHTSTHTYIHAYAADQDGMTTVNGVLCVGMAAYGTFYFGRAIYMHACHMPHTYIRTHMEAYIHTCVHKW